MPKSLRNGAAQIWANIGHVSMARRDGPRWSTLALPRPRNIEGSPRRRLHCRFGAFAIWRCMPPPSPRVLLSVAHL